MADTTKRETKSLRFGVLAPISSDLPPGATSCVAWRTAAIRRS
ncbi:hypothetical protein [Amycolatopsis sp. GA6-003]